MKKIIAVSLIVALLVIGAGTVLAGGDQVQMRNPDFLPGSDHNTISHCFQGEVSNK
ncbi:MAG TPA: hypothetical protein PLP30_05910 [Clostridia bacterium]|jgi:hypothetical protein|nr:hypothetical protein [Clostridia bacterium]HPQ46882.1 hypothetical protein [Clostridia bacterium]HRX43173.1 hypothetical protein [Clostridia bacterium]